MTQFLFILGGFKWFRCEQKNIYCIQDISYDKSCEF